MIKIIIHAPGRFLPRDCLNSKYRILPSCGFIHIISQKDYLKICQTFITPAEIKEYLNFRESISLKYSETVHEVSEQAIIGQFVYGDFGVEPDKKYEVCYETLLRTHSELDFLYILHNIHNHIIDSGSQEDKINYYKILIEFAKLAGNELRDISERTSLALQSCNNNELQMPSRTVSVVTGCGFAFIPITKEFFPSRQVVLENITKLAKYDQILDRCIGISFAKDDSSFLIDWAIADYPWCENTELENHLSKYPLGEMKTVNLPRYCFINK